MIAKAYADRRAATSGSVTKLTKRWVDGPRVSPTAPKNSKDAGWTDRKWLQHLNGLTDAARKPFECYAAQTDAEYFAQLSNAYLGTNMGIDPTTGQPRKNGRAWIKAHEPKEIVDAPRPALPAQDGQRHHQGRRAREGRGVREPAEAGAAARRRHPEARERARRPASSRSTWTAGWRSSRGPSRARCARPPGRRRGCPDRRLGPPGPPGGSPRCRRGPPVHRRAGATTRSARGGCARCWIESSDFDDYLGAAARRRLRHRVVAAARARLRPAGRARLHDGDALAGRRLPRGGQFTSLRHQPAEGERVFGAATLTAYDDASGAAAARRARGRRGSPLRCWSGCSRPGCGVERARRVPRDRRSADRRARLGAHAAALASELESAGARRPAVARRLTFAVVAREHARAVHQDPRAAAGRRSSTPPRRARRAWRSLLEPQRERRPACAARAPVDLAVELDARAAVAGVEQYPHRGCRAPSTSGGQTPPCGDSGVTTIPAAPGASIGPPAASV